MSGGGGQATTTNTTSNTANTPYAPSVPYLLQGLQDAAKIYSQGPNQYTPWSQIAGFTPDQQAAQSGIINYATGQGTQDTINNVQNATVNQLQGGNNYLQPNVNAAQNTVSGYLNNNNLQDNANVYNTMAYGDQTNPYLDQQVQSSLQQMSNNFMSNTLPGLRRAAIGTDTYGSSRNALAEGAAAGALDQQMQNTANQMYMQDYATQEQNRLGALTALGNQQAQRASNANSLLNQYGTDYLNNIGVGLSNYTNAAAMPLDQMNNIWNVGLQQYGQNQNELTDATNRWNYEQNAGWDNLSKFKALIDSTSSYGGSGSGSGVTAQYNPPTNTAGNIAGGLLQAASIGAMMYGGKGGAPGAGTAPTMTARAGGPGWFQ